MPSPTEIAQAVGGLKGLLPMMTEDQQRRTAEILGHSDYRHLSRDALFAFIRDYGDTAEAFNLATFRSALADRFGSEQRRAAVQMTAERLRRESEAARKAREEWSEIDATLAEIPPDELREMVKLVPIEAGLRSMALAQDVTNPKSKLLRGIVFNWLKANRMVPA